MSDDIAFLSAAEAGRRIAAGTLSSAALVRHMLERIEALNGRLHTYITIVADRALAGTFTPEMITALDRCAYAELSPFQARIARRLLSGDQAMVEQAANRLEDLGEPAAAEQLRQGDLTAVALAARLIPV